MNQQIKLDNLEKTFVVSDCHFRHNKDFIWGRRGFQSVEEHDEGVIREWNSRVGEHDVFHLGDFIFQDASGEKTLEYIKKLNFKRLYVLFGNHASGIKSIYKKTLEENFLLLEEVEIFPLVKKLGKKELIFLPNLVEVSIGKHLFVLSHYPIISHNYQSKGSYMICGHSHGNCALTNKDSGKGRRLDVGIENFGGPISLRQVMEHLKDRDLDCVDHH